MDNTYIFNPIIVHLFLFFSVGICKQFVVTDFGAVPDGKTDSRKALETAWQRACQTPGGSVLVPRGSFFVSMADFYGPCKGPTLFEHRGTLVASADPTLGERDHWIIFAKLDGLTVFGDGVLDGNGALSWSRCGGLAHCKQQLPPATLKMNYVTNSMVRGVRLINSKMFHVIIWASDSVWVRGVRITAPANSPNTDGIHIGDSSNTQITGSRISTGDDCISIGEGCTSVNVTRVRCGPGHGISIGSLGKYPSEGGVGQVHVRNCTFLGTENGLRIKTWAPSLSSTVVSGVVYEEIEMRGVRNPILIDQFYCPGGSCQPGGESSVEIRGVRFENVRGSSASQASVSLKCSRTHPCRDIEFVGLHLTHGGRPTIALCANADDRFGGSGQIPSRCS
ncbi:pectin lyase-like superfamily protein [Striga asiatica]|uniref:Pectin lyase-like superfamily protein n=1 Tax=Striga asiatica TaxID=4170 RepID=A0A5A7PQZ0_STRAF|nr:pectin lyase-like superfamily protein [Striga asiatica]